jgi:hypothetical protein
MSLIATSQSRDFEKPEPGTYAGTCYRVIDLGTQKTSYQGQDKLQRKVFIGFEINKNMTDGRPFVVNNRYTLSLSDKAQLRAFLEGWRGRKFSKEEEGGFDLKNLLGKSCMLSLIENNGYINIASASKLMQGLTLEPLHNPIQFFSLDAFDIDIFNSLPEGLREMINKSPEYHKAVGQHPEIHHSDDVSGHAMEPHDFDDACPF